MGILGGRDPPEVDGLSAFPDGLLSLPNALDPSAVDGLPDGLLLRPAGGVNISRSPSDSESLDSGPRSFDLCALWMGSSGSLGGFFCTMRALEGPATFSSSMLDTDAERPRVGLCTSYS